MPLSRSTFEIKSSGSYMGQARSLNFEGSTSVAVTSDGQATINVGSTSDPSASLALQQLAEYAADNKIAPGEKPAVISTYIMLTGEQQTLDNLADRYETDRTFYDRSITELTTMMSGVLGYDLGTNDIYWSSFTSDLGTAPNNSFVSSTNIIADPPWTTINAFIVGYDEKAPDGSSNRASRVRFQGNQANWDIIYQGPFTGNYTWMAWMRTPDAVKRDIWVTWGDPATDYQKITVDGEWRVYSASVAPTADNVHLGNQNNVTTGSWTGFDLLVYNVRLLSGETGAGGGETFRRRFTSAFLERSYLGKKTGYLAKELAERAAFTASYAAFTASHAFMTASEARDTAGQAWQSAEAALNSASLNAYEILRVDASATIAFEAASAAFGSATLAFDRADEAFDYADDAFASASVAQGTADTAFSSASIAKYSASLAFTSASAAFGSASAAFTKAGNAEGVAAAANFTSSLAFSSASTAFAEAEKAHLSASSAFSSSNAALVQSAVSQYSASLAFNSATLAFATANEAHASASDAFDQADAAFASASEASATLVLKANVSFSNVAAQTITGYHIKGTTISGTHIAGQTISGSHIKFGTMSGTHMSVGTISGTYIASQTISGSSIVFGTMSGSHLAVGTISGTYLASQTISGSHIKFGTMSGTHLAAQTISGTHIAAQSITAEKLLIGSWDNLVENGSFEQGISGSEGWLIPNATFTIDTAEARTGLRSLKGTGNGTIQDMLTTKWYDVEPNDEFYCSAWIKTSPESNGTKRGIFFYVYDKNKGITQYTGVGTLTGSTGSWTFVDGVVTMPVSAAFMRFGPSIRNDSTSGTVWFDDFYVQKKMTGKLIVDGTISGTHIIANTIQGNHLQFGTISGTHIAVGTISGTDIASQTISGTHIVFGTMSGSHLSVGTISGTYLASQTISGSHIKFGTMSGSHLAVGTISGTYLASQTISGSHIKVGTLVGDHIQAATISGSKIVADTIGAREIAANSITTQNLTVTNFDNLWPNGNSAQQAPPGADASTAEFVLMYDANSVGQTGYNGTRYVRRAYQGTGGEQWFGIGYPPHLVPCNPGDQFYYEAYARMLAKPGTTGEAYLYMRFFKQDQSTISSQTSNAINAVGGWTKLSCSVTAPVSATYVAFNFETHGNAIGTEVWFDALYARRKNDGNLIIDGGILARHITASAINADMISAGAVTVDKLDVLVRNHVNNFSTTNLYPKGWSPWSSDGEIAHQLVMSAGGSPGAPQKSGRNVRVLHLRNSGPNGHEINSDAFEINPEEDYQITISLYSETVDAGTDYIGLRGIDINGNEIGVIPYNQTSAYWGSQPATGWAESTTNGYWWYEAATLHKGRWIDFTLFLMGCNRTEKEMLTSYAIDSNDGTFARRPVLRSYKMQPDTKSIRLRFLNFYNAGTPRSLWVFSPTVTSLAGGAIRAAKIYADNIQAYEITGDKIAANTISAASMKVGGPGAALNPDPSCADSRLWNGWPPGSFTTVTNGSVGNTVIRAGGGEQIFDNAVRLTPVDYRKKYRLSCLHRKTADANGSFFLRFYTLNAVGNASSQVYTYAVEAKPAAELSTSWTRYSGTLTLNSDVASGHIGVVFNYQGTAGYHEVQDVRLEEMVPGSLIVDGTITTQNLNADAITTSDYIEVWSLVVGGVRQYPVEFTKTTTAAARQVYIDNGWTFERVKQGVAMKVQSSATDKPLRIGTNGAWVGGYELSEPVVRSLQGIGQAIDWRGMRVWWRGNASSVNSGAPVLFDKPWAANTPYKYQDRVSAANARVYVCDVPGTSSATEPTSTVASPTQITDGTVKWIYEGDRANNERFGFTSWHSYEIATGVWHHSFFMALQTRHINDNHDGMRYVKLEFHDSSGNWQDTHFVYIPDRMYQSGYEVSDWNNANWPITTVILVTNSLNTRFASGFWNGYMKATVYNVRGSTSRWYRSVDGSAWNNWSGGVAPSGQSNPSPPPDGDEGGGTCPAPETLVLMEDGSYRRIIDIVVGEAVWTRPENGGPWGCYPVTGHSVHTSERVCTKFADGRKLVTSPPHRLCVGSEWMRVDEMKPGMIVSGIDLGQVVSVEPYEVGPVVKMTVGDAHTYVTEGLLSHNAKIR
jgi:hypothetical protein